MRQAVLTARQAGKTIGLVPTMGALHEGHLTLLDAARAECDLTVVSIFVNPTQFAPQEDFRKYPRDLERDMALLGGRGCDIVFAPSEGTMYAAEPRHVRRCRRRPARCSKASFAPPIFAASPRSCMKLFQLAPADRAYFGRKDYQQTIVVRQMVADLNVPVDVRVCPTMREPDGLAMSSRNVYLSADERQTRPRPLALASSSPNAWQPTASETWKPSANKCAARLKPPAESTFNTSRSSPTAP